MINDVIHSTQYHIKYIESAILANLHRRLPHLTIGSCFSVHYRVMEHVGSLEKTKEA